MSSESLLRSRPRLDEDEEETCFVWRKRTSDLYHVGLCVILLASETVMDAV